MKLLKTVQEVRQFCHEQRKKSRSIGLVPTMGALHAGHASLIKAASQENDVVVVSVFINPTQFGPTEDLSSYPRTLDADCILAEQMGADIVFAPAAQEMYPFGEGVWVEVTGHITQILCGRSRPTHFRGVTTVVSKLFNIVMPDRAYFGQKDGQQAQVIRRMAKDLFMPIDIRIMPIIREHDGLALSSRNIYLSEDERKAALVLSLSLKNAQAMIGSGERDADKVLAAIKQEIASESLAELDYAELYSFPTLDEIKHDLDGEIFIALAVKIGTTRLIDNIIILVK